MNRILAQFFLIVRVGYFKAILVTTINLLVAVEHRITVHSDLLPPYAVWR